MSTWVLILTLISPIRQGGSAIHSVPGFKDEAGCMAAAHSWAKTVKREDQYLVFANCVEQKK